jgi:G3E family GTPase
MLPIEILIVTGPLGAGKTTAVNRILKAEVASAHRVAVLINEFGAVSIDGTLVNAELPELAGIENLVNGCVCCSLREDVIATLKAWCDQPEEVRPHRVLLETTGLADPTDLIDLEFDPTLQGRMKLVGVLSVISALTPLDHFEQRPLLRRQIGLASLIYLSKADLDPSSAVAWESEMRRTYPKLPIVQTRHGEAPTASPDPWRGEVSTELPADWEKGQGPSFADTRSFALEWDHPIDPAALEALFQKPLDGGELLRAKGTCAFAGWPPRNDGSDRWTFQLADWRLEISPLPLMPDGSAAPLQAVLIGVNLDVPAWKKALRALERPPEGARKKVVLNSERIKS